MASGHANRTQAEHMAAPTQACDVRKVLANPEPSTHGTKRRIAATRQLGRNQSEADIGRRNARIVLGRS